MSEYGSNNFEKELSIEHIPTAEEVRAELRDLIGKDFTELKNISDETGLLILEVEAAGAGPGERDEYTYMRTGHYSKDSGLPPVMEIHVVYYDQNGDMISGKVINMAR